MANILIHWMWIAYIGLSHPFYVSMTEIQYNKQTQALEISVRIFTDDFENTLRKNHPGAKIDILHPADPEQMNKYVNDYLQTHLRLQVNKKPVQMLFVGYEQQTESIWIYFEAKQVAAMEKLDIYNSLLHEFNNNQINMIHVQMDKSQKSTRLNFPDTNASFIF